jgi:hypothetical protein
MAVLLIAPMLGPCGPASAQVDEAYSYRVARFAHQLENAASQLKKDADSFKKGCDLVDFADKLRDAASQLKDKALEVPGGTPDKDKGCRDAWKAVVKKFNVVKAEIFGDNDLANDPNVSNSWKMTASQFDPLTTLMPDPATY